MKKMKHTEYRIMSQEEFDAYLKSLEMIMQLHLLRVDTFRTFKDIQNNENETNKNH